MKTLLDRHILTPTIEKLIQDYYVKISYNADYDAYPIYFGYQDHCKNLSRNHRELLKIFRDEKFKGKEVRKLEFEDIYSIRKSKKLKKTEKEIPKKLYNLYKKYFDILDEMEEYSFYELLSDKVQNECKIKSDLIQTGPDYILITHPEIRKWKLFNEEKEEIWPIYIEYQEYRKQKTGDDEVIRKMQIYIDLNKIPEGYLKPVEGFIEKEGYIIKANKRYYKIAQLLDERPNDEELLNHILNRYNKLSELFSSL